MLLSEPLSGLQGCGQGPAEVMGAGFLPFFPSNSSLGAARARLCCHTMGTAGYCSLHKSRTGESLELSELCSTGVQDSAQAGLISWDFTPKPP